MKYEVRMIQEGILFYRNEGEDPDGKDKVYSDQKMITVVGRFPTFEFAKLMAETLEKEIAAGQNYVMTPYTPKVKIFKIEIKEEEIFSERMKGHE